MVTSSRRDADCEPDLAQAVGIDESSMCFTCHTGDYATLGVTPSPGPRGDPGAG